MPHYYFDLKDGTRLRDHAGVDLETDAAAIAHAETVAAEVASEHIAGPQRFVSIIRDDGNEVGRVPVPQSNIVRLARRGKR